MAEITRRAASGSLVAAASITGTAAASLSTPPAHAQPAPGQPAPAQPAAPAFPDAAATDPATLGWMQGTPPPAGKRIAFEDGSFSRFPQNRWAFSNWRMFLRNVAVERGEGPVWDLPVALRDDLDAVRFTPLGAGAPMTWQDSLAANYTDAILVLQRGRIVYERYFGVTTPRTQHILFSVTKSFVGVLAQILITEGRLDPQAPVTSIIPELAGSGFGDATVRQVLDMTTALDYDETYTSAQSGIARYAMAGRVTPRPPGYAGPEGLLDFAPTVAAGQGRHGGGFVYRTINTEVLAWLVARIEGRPVDQVLGERIWSRLGMEADAALVVDGVGTPMAGGGLMARLRDCARFGEAMRLGGLADGRQAIPAAAVAAIASGGDPSKFDAASYPALPGASYHAQWWFTHNAHGAYMARGIHGQGIYVDPAAQMVIARFGSHPVAGNAGNDPVTLPAYHALAQALRQGG